MGSGPKIKGQATSRPVAAARITPEQVVAEPVAERSRVAEEKLTPANAATAESFIETISRIGMDNYAKLDPSTFTGEIGKLIKEQLDTMPNTVSSPATYQTAWKRVKNIFELAAARGEQIKADDMSAFSDDVKNNLDKKAKATMPDNWAETKRNEIENFTYDRPKKTIEAYFKGSKIPKGLIDDLVKAGANLYVAKSPLKYDVTLAKNRLSKLKLSPEALKIGVRIAEQKVENKIKIAQAAYDVVVSQIIDSMLPA